MVKSRGKIIIKEKSIGGFLNWYVERHGFTNATLAEKLSVTHGMISHIRTNRFEAPLSFLKLLKPHLTPIESKYLLECFIEHMSDALEGLYDNKKRTVENLEAKAKAEKLKASKTKPKSKKA